MTEWDILHAMDHADAQSIREALGDSEAPAARAALLPRILLTAGCAAACIAVTGSLGAAICQLNSSRNEISVQASQYETEPVKTETSAPQTTTAAGETESAAVTSATTAVSTTESAAVTSATTAVSETEAAATTPTTVGPAFARIDTEAVRRYFAPVYALGTDVSAYQKGDIDMNGRVDLRDRELCAAAQRWKIIARTETYRKMSGDCPENWLTEDQILLGDVNKETEEQDFQPVNSRDGSVIGTYVYFNDFLHTPMTMEEAAAYCASDPSAVPEGYDRYLEESHALDYEREWGQIIFG